MKSCLLIALVVVVGFACAVSARSQVERKKELEAILTGPPAKHMDKHEILAILKELKEINDEEMAKIPKIANFEVPDWFGNAGEARRINERLTIFIAAGEVDAHRASDFTFVNHITREMQREVKVGHYRNIHGYLEEGIDAWWQAYKESKHYE